MIISARNSALQCSGIFRFLYVIQVKFGTKCVNLFRFLYVIQAKFGTKCVNLFRFLYVIQVKYGTKCVNLFRFLYVILAEFCTKCGVILLKKTVRALQRTILTALLSGWKQTSKHELFLWNLEVDFQLLSFCTKLGSRLPSCERQTYVFKN